ncbi:tetrapyrrole biosynthesis, uroporphyrinogen III synthase [Vararia minispora EC-137]|uniref:Tetrapyrrole biosynthesis, uroporphyrinogen III synthase n=1 Tax=Vararia minispora EC-137 TaxID=1314806 RepID=A0ACB8QP30_9AGAM|nr:tetrapyrrole biosynthesis, uroporphyrinogen III synthase [Vararia minispora EC-137]
MPSPVLLLRAPTENDRYDSALRSSSFIPFSLPVLQTTLHIDGLKQIVSRPPDVRGVIVTSARAAEAWGKAVDDILSACAEVGSSVDWRAIPFYTVGPATASLLRSLSGPSPSPSRVQLCPSNIRGMQSGNAEALAHFIVSDQHETPGATLLYLTGDKNRDTLSNIVKEARLKIREEQVYRTDGVELGAFEESVLGTMKEEADPQRPASGEPWWIVCFAPSSTSHVLPVLRRHFHLPGDDSTSEDASKTRARLAAIGPTTADFLREQSLRVDAIPSRPSADALVEALRGAQ